MRIEVRDLIRRHGNMVALDRVSLTAENGEFLALLGPSGSGKTTLLRIIAGLDYPDSGSVLFDGRDATRLKIQKRRVGFVFQNYALFRHMTVAKNIAFGLEVKSGRDRPSSSGIRHRVSELLRLVQLPDLGKRYPHQLSG